MTDGEMSRLRTRPSNCTPKTISYKQIAGKYTACTKDEANRIADNNLQSDGISYANGLAQADRCDCVEPTKTWSAYASGSFNWTMLKYIRKL